MNEGIGIDNGCGRDGGNAGSGFANVGAALQLVLNSVIMTRKPSPHRLPETGEGSFNLAHADSAFKSIFFHRSHRIRIRPFRHNPGR